MTKGKDEIRITELVDGDPIFESKGVSRVKVTKDGKAQALMFPIRSTGVADLVDKFSKKEPRPPVITELIEPESRIGKQLRLGRKQHIKMLDFSNSDYLEKKEKHDRDLGLAIFLLGLDIYIKDMAGKPFTYCYKTVEVHKRLGMTGDQFMQIIGDIQDLTKWDKENRADFFDEP